jgi:hypothetical protein
VRVWSLSPAESCCRIDDKKLWISCSQFFRGVAGRERENLIEWTNLVWLEQKRRENTSQIQEDYTVETRQGIWDKQISLAAISRILDIPCTTLYRHKIEFEGK